MEDQAQKKVDESWKEKAKTAPQTEEKQENQSVDENIIMTGITTTTEPAISKPQSVLY